MLDRTNRAMSSNDPTIEKDQATAGEAIKYRGPDGSSSESPLRKKGSDGITGDRVFYWSVYVCATIVILMITSLLMVLINSSRESIKEFGFKFLVSTERNLEGQKHFKKDANGKIERDDDDQQIVDHVDKPVFGALPVIYGTAVSSTMALLFAVPFSLGAALFLIRIAPTLRPAMPSGKKLPIDIWISFIIEFLAAIPSIAYGLWGVLVLVPFMGNHIDPGLNRFFGWMPGLGFLHADGNSGGRDMLTGSLVLAIMVIPIITAVSRDVLRSVPNALVEGSLALGATWWQSCWEMLRYSRSGLFGAVMLGLARASGETMAVTMVIGNTLEIHSSPLVGAQTMSGLLANEFGNATGLHRSGNCCAASTRWSAA